MIQFEIKAPIGREYDGNEYTIKCMDPGVTFAVELFTVEPISPWRERAIPYQIPEGSTATLRVTRPDRAYTNTKTTIEGGIIFCPVHPYSVATPGKCSADVAVYGPDGNRITSATFHFFVDRECAPTAGENAPVFVDSIQGLIEFVEQAADRAEAAADRAESSGGGNGSNPPKDGITPHIGENGNWYLGDTDTGVSAEGEDGEDGGHYTPVITQPTADTMKVEFLPSRAGMAAVEPVEIKLPVGSGNDSGQNDNAGIPAGVIAEASSVVGKALSHGDSRVFQFLAFSDAHQNNNDEAITAGNKELGQAVGEVLRQIGVDFVANLGDTTWSSSSSDLATVLAEAKAFNRFISDSLWGQTQIWTEGNHETAFFNESQLRALIYSHNTWLVKDADHFMEGYGYMDFPAQRVRVIVLNTDQSTGNDTSGVSDAQLKWFAETALDMSEKTDWNVITMGHHPLDYNNITMMKNCMWVLEAFLNGANLDFTTNTGTRIAVNYGDKCCQYVGHFHGHTHAFSVVRLQKWVASETYEELDAWEIGIPNACYRRNNQNLNNGQYTARYATETTYNKTDEDGKRTAFNLITIGLDERVIYADNYGAGVDRVISYAPGAEEIVTCSIIRNLTNCTSSSAVASVIKGELHDETLAAASGYTMDGATVTVTMGGVDVTDSVYADGALNIANVTGDIIITASAVAANLLVIGQRTFDPMTGMANLVATDPRDMDYTKIYGGSRDGKRGTYYAGKLATFTLNAADNGFTYSCTSASGYGPEFPVAMVGGKSYRLRMTSTTRFPSVYLLKFDADGVFVDATRIKPEMADPTNTVDIITAESGYLYSLHFSLTTANIDITMRNISLVETV